MIRLCIYVITCTISSTVSCPIGSAGPNCETNCSDTCHKKACTITLRGDINCTYGCEAGYFGEPCTMRCDAQCKRCHRLARHNCTECRENHNGPRCAKTSISTDSPPLSIAFIVIIVLALVVAVCIIVIGLLVYRNRNKRRHNTTVAIPNSTVANREQRSLPPIPPDKDTKPEYCEIQDAVEPSLESRSMLLQTNLEIPHEPPAACNRRLSNTEDISSRLTRIQHIESDIEVQNVLEIKPESPDHESGKSKMFKKHDAAIFSEHTITNKLYQSIGAK